MTFNFIEKKLQIDPEVKTYAEKKIGKLERLSEIGMAEKAVPGAPDIA